MVLSDLILGWSLLVTGHADSFIISYIYLRVRFSLYYIAVKWALAAHFYNTWCDCHQTNCSPKNLSIVGFGINSLWEKQKSPRSIHVCGAIECTVIRIQQQHVERKSYVLPLISLIYADLFNRCFLFVPVQVNTLQVWKDKKSHIDPLPVYSPHCGPTSWPRLSRCVTCLLHGWS